jgi:two-component system sensor histidine kinase UhpB
MSLQVKLISTLAALLAAFLVVLMALLLLQSAPRVSEETASMMQFVETFVRGSVDRIEHSPSPDAELEALIQSFRDVRHVRVRLVHTRSEPAANTDAATLADILADSLMGAHFPEPRVIDMTLSGGRVHRIVISANPGDELGELFDELGKIALGGVVVTLIAFLLTSWVVSRSLKPLYELRSVLGTMTTGRYDVLVSETGPPEVSSVARSANALAAELGRAKAENTRLSERLVRAQDDERSEIARELHDELGPHLFAARARASTLKDEVAKTAPDLAKARNAVDLVLEQINDIQSTNRRVLMKLEPAGLRELGLIAAVEGLVARWQREQPHVRLELEITGTMPLLDHSRSLTIYRVVQEGLTNAFRHSGASSITVQVAFPPPASAETPAAPSASEPRAIRIQIDDDGRGWSGMGEAGLGLSAMRQRIHALGGGLEVGTGATGGVSVKVLLPCIAIGR